MGSALICPPPLHSTAKTLERLDLCSREEREMGEGWERGPNSTRRWQEAGGGGGTVREEAR